MALSHPTQPQGTVRDLASQIPAATPVARGLYAITPDEPDTGRLEYMVSQVLPHATWLQYRNKPADRGLRREQVLALLPLCKAHGVPLIVNDDWRLASELGAQGAHLGEDDGDLAAARRSWGPDAILGTSCYDDLARAADGVALGASYIAFGAFFPSTTKPAARRASVGLLRDAAQLGVPRVAIGGITPDNTPQLVTAGADLVAVISGVFDAVDPAAAARAYAACFPHPDPAPQPAQGI